MDDKNVAPHEPWRRSMFVFNLRAWMPSRGNIIFTLLVAFCLIGSTRAWAAPQNAPARAGTSAGTIAYQGRLADTSGAALTGSYIMVFRLYNVASGGLPLWEESWTGINSVQVNTGLFNVMLGSLTPIPQSLTSSNGSLWLGIDVGSDAEMTPRVQLGSAPYAFQAQHANVADRTTGLSAPDGDPVDAVTVDNNGNVGIGTASPQAKMQISGQNGLLRLWNEDANTASTSYVESQLGVTNPAGGGNNNWLSMDTYGEGYVGTIGSADGATVSLNRMDVISADGEGIIFGNYLNKPFYFMQSIMGGSYYGPSRIPLTIAGDGNIGIGTTSPSHPLETSGGAYVSADGVWTNSSDRNLKENFTAIDGKSLLEKIVSLPISKWNYKATGNVKHIGPMAQDFYAAFKLGEDDKHISTVDASGVALAAIQSLDQLVKQQNSQIVSQQQQIAALDARVAALEQTVGGMPTAQPSGLFSGWDIIVILVMAGGLIVCWRYAPKRGVLP